MKIIVSVLGNFGSEINKDDIENVNTNDLFMLDAENWHKLFIERLDSFLDKKNHKTKILLVDSYIETLELLKKHEYKFLLLTPCKNSKTKWLEEMVKSTNDVEYSLTMSEAEFLYTEAIEFEYDNRLSCAIKSKEDIEWMCRSFISSSGSFVNFAEFNWITYK